MEGLLSTGPTPSSLFRHCRPCMALYQNPKDAFSQPMLSQSHSSIRGKALRKCAAFLAMRMRSILYGYGLAMAMALAMRMRGIASSAPAL